DLLKDDARAVAVVAHLYVEHINAGGVVVEAYLGRVLACNGGEGARVDGAACGVGQVDAAVGRLRGGEGERELALRGVRVYAEAAVVLPVFGADEGRVKRQLRPGRLEAVGADRAHADDVARARRQVAVDVLRSVSRQEERGAE